MPLKRSTILIIDSDLGSAFWLGQLLDAAGCESLPAKSLTDAKSLLAGMKISVDLLIVRFPMPGAAAFAESLRWSQGHLKTIGLLEDNEEISERDPRMDAWLQKPFLTDDASKFDYLDLIGWVLVKNIVVRPVLPAPTISLC
jgi:DNA-binding response OmpR family regulator